MEQLVRVLVDTISKGDNCLLNFGPTTRGDFGERALDYLAGGRGWMRGHALSPYECAQLLTGGPRSRSSRPRRTKRDSTARLRAQLCSSSRFPGLTWQYRWLSFCFSEGL